MALRPADPLARSGPVAAALELWGGVECTLNRVGDRYFDQLELSGHLHRPADLDLFAELGFRALRYPVLWERTMPGVSRAPDWSWADVRLSRIRELGIRPIVGLVHHGSGPPYTDLLDEEFVPGLARFAHAVAERYPWVSDYTPVNEPLTTARFSGLYGHWYPHGLERRVFARALLTQCRAVAEAMRAIREVNPSARLVQTEDLGKTRSTPRLAYQADFENERRWLTYDLLCGKVDRDHPMWSYLLWSEVEERDLEPFLVRPCPPDIIGLNHYLTSERFLDERLERYPAATHGGNERQRYADVEAVRVLAEGPDGVRLLLREAWARYGLPLAVTEVHLGCTREEQLRWFKEIWEAGRAVRAEGTDLRAVTAWSLLGSFGWISLATRATGYEPGAFDVRAPVPRATGLARMLRDVAAGRDPRHPVLESPGWWRRPQRLLYPPVSLPPSSGEPVVAVNAGAEPRPIVIVAPDSPLGACFVAACAARGLAYRGVERARLEPGFPGSVEPVLAALRPWAVVNAAEYAAVDKAERESEACGRENVELPAALASACARIGAALLTFSSDLVFDGAATSPYLEHDEVAPINVYGRSKAEAERAVLARLPEALVVRSGPRVGLGDAADFVAHVVRRLTLGRVVTAAADVVSPTVACDLVHAALDLLVDGERGVWHLANTGAVSWVELARRVAALADLDPSLVRARPAWALGHAAPRPVYSALASGRGTLLAPLEEVLGPVCRESLRSLGGEAPRRRGRRAGARA